MDDIIMKIFSHFGLQIHEVIAIFKITSKDRGVLNGFESNGFGSSGMVQNQGSDLQSQGFCPGFFLLNITQSSSERGNFGQDNMRI